MSPFTGLLVAGVLLLSVCCKAQTEIVTGTIFGNNYFKLYVNGREIADDPIDTIPHNAVNVTFEASEDEDITFAIEAWDLADDNTGLELGNRCVGSGGLRAMFSNGVVTNSSWTCLTWHYGPVNWQECFATDPRDPDRKVLPQCMNDTTPPLEGCYARITNIPNGWTAQDFDDSNWEFALEYEDGDVGWGLRPPGCDTPGAILSTDTDPNGDRIICPEFLDWSEYGESKFIWREDLRLDNRLLCRYTLRRSSTAAVRGFYTMLVLVAMLVGIGLY